jgi:hypothetical protein
MGTNEYWTNSDGLNVRFGLEKATAHKEGRLSTMGNTHQHVTKITGTSVPSSDGLVSTHPVAGIPDGAHIVAATLHVRTAFTSTGAATLTLGLWNDDGDGTFSVNDADGIDAAIAITAIDADGDQIACDGAKVGSGAGALAGTGDRPLYVSYAYGVAAFTAGEADLVIEYTQN